MAILIESNTPEIKVKLSNMNRASAKIVHETVNKYMKMAAAELGMSVKPSSARFTAVDFSKKITLVLESPESNKVKTEYARNVFQQFAAVKGFNPSYFGKTLMFGYKKLKVVGYTSKRYAKPIDLLDVATGKPYICRIAALTSALPVD